MCELFCMSSRQAATVTLSMDEFARHGGLTGPHADGWGIAFFDRRDVRLIKEPEAAADSPWLAFLKQHEIRSTTVISHIRHATSGEKRLSNTHPFSREMGGRMHVFAHNGTLSGVDGLPCDGPCRPVGDTDSERAFCFLLSRLAAVWPEDGSTPARDVRIDTVAAVAAELRALGPANFIYSDSELLFAHGHRRLNGHYIIEPPGLHLLCRRCAAENGALETHGLSIDQGDQEVVLAASVPLTSEGWQPFAEGELVVLEGGRIVERRLP